MSNLNTKIRHSQIADIAPTDITANATNAVVDGYIPSKAAGADQWTWVANTASTLPVVDTTGIAKGSVDATKIVRLEVDGLTTATTRVLTVQDKDGTISLTNDKLSAFAVTTSAELLGIISDETGSGLLVFATSPIFITQITTPKIVSAGDLTIDAVNAAANSTVNITNSDATYKANLAVEGNISAATYGSDGTITDAELLFINTLSSNAQDQINSKAPSTAPTFATSITASYLTASEILITDADKKIISAPVVTYPSLTELSYVKGLTSAITGLLNAKAPVASPTFTTKITTPIIDLTGGQIAFPATAVPSADPNTLDDYEEGTWTPTLTFGGASVDMTYNTTFTSGYYEKIGGMVHLSGFIMLSAKGTSAGNAFIANIPYTVNDYNGAYTSTSVWYYAVSFANQHQAVIVKNSTTIELAEITEAGAQTNLVETNFADNSQIRFSVTYRSN